MARPTPASSTARWTTLPSTTAQLSPSQIGTLYSGQLPAHLPAGTPVQLGSGAVLDLNGISETVASLADVTAGSGGTITSSLSGELTLTLAPAANTTTSYSGVLQNGSGTLSLVMSGSGTQILAGSNTYSGGTTIKGGVLDITGTGSLPGWNTAATRVSAGGALVLGDAVTDGNVSSLLGAATFNAGALIGFDTSNGDRSYGAAIVNTSAGSLGLLKLGGNTLFLTGTNTYTGGTTVGAGVLSLASAAALPGWSTANAYKINSGGGLAVGDAFADADVAAILATGNFAAGAALGFDTSNGDRTYAVNITDTTAGSLALVKLGGNTLFLAGTNTYTGGTTVGNGALSMATTARAARLERGQRLQDQLRAPPWPWATPSAMPTWRPSSPRATSPPGPPWASTPRPATAPMAPPSSTPARAAWAC